MEHESSRTRRVGEQIQRELAQLIQLEVKDPRVKWVTISAVHVTRDFSHATVYFTVLGKNADEIDSSVEAGLYKAAGFLRRELGHRIKLRTIPQLHFKYDDSTERGNKLVNLIDQAIASDKK